MHAIEKSRDADKWQEPAPGIGYAPDDIRRARRVLKNDDRGERYKHDARPNECLAHSYGVTFALISNSSTPPVSSSRYTKRSIVPTPAGPCALGSKMTATPSFPLAGMTSFARGTELPCPGMPKGPRREPSFTMKAVVHMHEVVSDASAMSVSVGFMISNIFSTFPFFIEIVPKS